MSIAFFDPFSGASGDMVLGALVNAGLSFDVLRSELKRLPVEGYELSSEEIDLNSVRGTKVEVTVTAPQPARTWAAIQEIIGGSSLPESIRQRALAIFEALALAESAVHGVSIEEVHFHEVGAVDAIVDICGTAIGIEALAIDRIFSGPVRVGAGFVRAQHGLLPVPAPATAQLIANAGAPMLAMPAGHEGVEAELLTPTGAAILTTLARFEQPPFIPGRVAHGFGSRQLPWPNALRLWIGEEPAAEVDSGSLVESGQLVVVETNIDDMSPQAYELLTERLFDAGALDVWLTPVHMKKGRPGIVITVLAAAAAHGYMEQVLFGNSTTLGVRWHQVQRTALDREFQVVSTRFGDVRLKLKIMDGRIVDAAPEYDDCVRLARQHERPFQEVWEDSRRMGDRLIGRDPGAI